MEATVTTRGRRALHEKVAKQVREQEVAEVVDREAWPRFRLRSSWRVLVDASRVVRRAREGGSRRARTASASLPDLGLGRRSRRAGARRPARRCARRHRRRPPRCAPGRGPPSHTRAPRRASCNRGLEADAARGSGDEDRLSTHVPSHRTSATTLFHRPSRGQQSRAV